MDLSIKANLGIISFPSYYVSILILMDLSIKASPINLTSSAVKPVSILILMDLSIKEVKY